MRQVALALDCASNTGWCVVGRGMKSIVGTWRRPSEPEGRYGKMFASMFTFLGDMHMVHQFEAVGYEMPWKRAGDKMHTLRILHGLTVVVETWCGIHNVPCMEVPATMAKKALTGNSYAEKWEMKAAAIRMGIPVDNDDEADAFGVGMCVVASMWPRVAP